MKNIISAKFAGNFAIALLILLVIMHALILLQILPTNFVWGAKTTDLAEINKLETIALITSLVFLSIFILKMNLLNNGKSQKVINIFIWLMFVWFTFNIVGNILSSSAVEKIIFISVSIILSLASLRLALEK